MRAKKGQKKGPKRGTHTDRGLARDLLLVQVESGLARPGYFPAPPAASESRRNLLKIERLRTSELALKVTFFRQASEWRKRETVWVF